MGKRTANEYFWKHVEERPGGVECKYCSCLFKGRPSISRIKSHFLRTPNQGTSVCDSVPYEVRLEFEGFRKRRKIVQSYVEDVFGSESEEPSSGDQVAEWSDDDSAASTWADDEEPGFSHPESQQPEARMTKGIQVRTTAMVGHAFRGNNDRVWSWLMDDEVHGVGVYGMGGVGKTALAKHINNRLLRDPNPFHHVYFVSVSQDCNARKLQDAIARAVGLSLRSFEDESGCATRLREALAKKKKTVLILDDVWEFVDHERVGIPLGSNACKLVITSRSRSMYRLTGCQHKIKLSMLSRQQSWNLCLNTLGDGKELPVQVEGAARSVVEQCEGLPLGIIRTAKCMRGVVDLREWRNILQELKGSAPRQQIMELFDSLKLSYNVLHNQKLKQVLMFVHYCMKVFSLI